MLFQHDRVVGARKRQRRTRLASLCSAPQHHPCRGEVADGHEFPPATPNQNRASGRDGGAGKMLGSSEGRAPRSIASPSSTRNGSAVSEPKKSSSSSLEANRCRAELCRSAVAGSRAHFGAKAKGSRGSIARSFGLLMDSLHDAL